MASQEDDNKLESKSNVNKEQERNFINVYKKFEYILKNKLEPFPKKIESLIEIWKSLSQCNQQNSEIGYIVQIMDWAKLHTLNIVLTGKWKMFKADFEAKLLSEVEKTQNELMKISDVFSKKFQKLADVIKNPWDDPILANLLHDNNATIGSKEIEFFCIETAYLVSVRLKKLCESQCEDLALNLVTAFMNCYNLSQTQNFSLNATKTHILFCFDIHVALLYKYNRRSEIVALFKKLTLEEGLHLIRRFAKKRVKISKVWRNYPEITFLASQVFVTAAVTKPIEESGNILKDLLDTWIAFSVEHSMLDKVETSIRRIIQAATAAQHIYVCCEVIYDKFGLKLKTFTIELYIRALTTDMNNLESQKTENDKEKFDETTRRLANGFYNLADILKDNIQVSRECALTAFSLEPTLERLRKIEDLARLSGFKVLDTGQIWECKLHPPISSSDEICWICNACGNWMCKPNLDLRLTTNFALNEALNFETLGISSQLCDDLAVVLNGPRYHLLSWLLRWEDLHRLCEMYLNDMERTKNLVTELKFVDIDYSMFATVKREPVDELAGIERGYERFLYADEKLVNMIEKSNPEPPEIPQAKSDPNTLKTLRMFRHNIKRNKPQVSQSFLESNNLGSSALNYSKDTNWFSNHCETVHSRDFIFNQNRLPDYLQQQNAFNQNSSRSFSDAFYNNLNSSSNSQFKRTPDGAVDFSSTSTRSSDHESKPLNVRDFCVNLNKRKPVDSMYDYGNHQKFSHNYMSSSENNFLHNMITYEFARTNMDMKRSKQTDFLMTSERQYLMRNEKKSNFIKQEKMPTPSTNLTNCEKVLNNALSLKVSSHTQNIGDKTPSQKQNVLKSNGSTQTLSRNDNVANYETLNLVKYHKTPLHMQYLGETDTGPSHSMNMVKEEKLNDTFGLVKQEELAINNQPSLNNNKITFQNVDFIKSEKPSSYPLVKYERFPSPNQGSDSSSQSMKINNKEHEAVSPSKGFPSFDKIPPPPHCSNSISNDSNVSYTVNAAKENYNLIKNSKSSFSNLNLIKNDTLQDHNLSKNDQHLLQYVEESENNNSGQLQNQLSPNNSNNHRNISQEDVFIEQQVSGLENEVYIKKEATSMSKNYNHFLLLELNGVVSKSSAKRTNDVDLDNVPEKKLKIDEIGNERQTLFRLKNGLHLDLDRELNKNKIIKALLSRDDKLIEKAEVQDKNSLKNADSCLPTNNSAINLEPLKKMHVINLKTPIVQSYGANNQQNVPQNKHLSYRTLDVSNLGQDINRGKVDKEELVKSDFMKEVNQTNISLLKTISEQHIPIIVEKSEEKTLTETKASNKTVVVKIDDVVDHDKVENEKKYCESEKKKGKENIDKNFQDYRDVKLSETNAINNDLFRYEDKPKSNTYKELKIILHRLSAEVIKSFIPSYTDTDSHGCNCGFDLKKKSLGRSPKGICCKYRSPGRIRNSSSSPTNRVFERIDYDKYSLRTLRRHNSERHKKITSRSSRRDSSDMQKKTGPNKHTKKYNKLKKIIPTVNPKRDDSDKSKKPKKDFCDKDKKIVSSKKGDIDKYKIDDDMNPRVVLERLPIDSNYVRSILSNVPGLNDYEMIRPINVNHIVNVVQLSGGRSTSNVPVQNTQTSTQITPHIQRIGQPRSDKPEHNTNSEMTIATTAPPASTSATTAKPSTSQSSTLINILSQQIIRPGQSNCVRNRSSPLINILSQQIIRPASTQMNKTATNSVQSSEEQTNNLPKVTLEQSSPNEVSPVKTTVTATTKTTTNTPSSGQGTILQFICKSTLPKFQQAFGKSVYQNNTETTDATSTCTETNTVTNTDLNKKTQTKNSSVNIQPIQGGVIYTRQMPVGQTINLIPPGRGQVFRIATSNAEQISLVKDTVIHSKMSALLAAALQGKQKTSESQSDGESNSEDATSNRVTVARPTLVQNARIVKPVLQIPSNVIRTSPQSNLSSTTLEQLREFDMVYKQIKERSSTSTPSEPNTSESNEQSQRISVTYVNQGQKYTQLSPVVVVSSYCNLQPAASPALSVTSQGSSSPCVTPAPAPVVPKVSSKSSKGKTVKNTTTQASKASPIPKPQQKPQEDEHTTQRIFDILAEYAEQLRNSPDLNNKPAPRRRSNPPTNPSQNSKRKKSSSSKKSGHCSSMVTEADIEDHRTVGSEDSSCGVVQISVQEEEQAHVQTATTESNDSSSGSRQQLILTDASGNNQTRNLIITDSSVGEALKMPNTAVLVPGNYIMPVSMVKGGQQIAVVSGGSKILATVPARSGPNMLLFQSFLNQSRNKTGVPTVKYSTIQPISGISSQSLAGVSGQPPVILPPNSHNLTAVTLGQPITLKKVEESTDRVNTELLLTISQPRDNGNSSTESSTQPDGTNAVTSTVSNIELEETIIHSDNSSEKIFHTYQKSMGTTPIATPVIAQTSCVKEEDTSDEQNTTQNSIELNITPENNKNESTKTLERVQSVLVTACTSNGPMLSHTPPRYRKPSESAGTNNEPSIKEEFLHNGEKQNNNEQKQFQGSPTYYHNKNKKTANPPRLDRELHQLCLQRKQAVLERELHLQKSLSEECEDLGVDEPSTSDLFPEADILFDANHSPSFDQSSQDLVKRPPPPPQDIKEEKQPAMTLFSDDDNSSSLRTDFLFESVEYQTTGTELVYDQNQQLTNGQSSASNESGSLCEDQTLLQNCASMSDVTLNSPVSPDPYHENTPPSLNKYKFKYSNRRKGERHKQASSEAWTAEVSSSEDTTGSTELGKSSSRSPESCTNKRSHSVSCDDELSDGSYKVVRVAISKSDLLKDDESCEELHCEDDLDCSPSGRGARRSVKKMCSCCNGSQDGGASRKRPASRPHTPAPHKKAFLNKKR